jgi:methionyl-tRNA formyltransferase
MKDLRIVFMGTPEFAVPSLEILVKNGFNVVAVVTVPDKPSGRGLKLTYSPVKEAALKLGLPVLQPEKLKSEEFINELKSYNANLQVVVAFRMLPESVWAMPSIGTFNLHGSLLPQYRGAAPINWAIINGEKETGVTTFFLKHEIDTGDILFKETEPISDEDNVGSVYERLMHKGANLVLKTVKAISEDNFSTTPQQMSGDVKMAPKIHKETCQINWNQSSQIIKNFIRGLSPYPAAWTSINDKNHKIYSVEILNENSNTQPGEFYSDGKKFIKVKTADGVLSIKELQMEGKKRMTAEEYLRGNKL